MKTIIAVGVVAAACAASAAAATQPLVPTFSQRAIAAKHPALAYVPSRIFGSYRYFRWTYSGGALHIFFRDRAKHEIVFVAGFRTRPCTAGREKTFQQAGNKVYWAQSANEQQAWRCVTGANGRTVQLTAATSQPPTQFADVGLGRIAASAHRIR